MEKGNAQPGLVGLFSTFRANEPQLFLEIDRTKAKSAGVALNDVFEAPAGLPGIGLCRRLPRLAVTVGDVQADRGVRMQAEDLRPASKSATPWERWCRSMPWLWRPTSRARPLARAHCQCILRPGLSTAPTVAGQRLRAKTISIIESNWPRRRDAAGDAHRMDRSYRVPAYWRPKRTCSPSWSFPLGCFRIPRAGRPYESFLPLAIILIVPMCLSARSTGVWLMELIIISSPRSA